MVLAPSARDIAFQTKPGWCANGSSKPEKAIYQDTIIGTAMEQTRASTATGSSMAQARARILCSMNTSIVSGIDCH